MEVFKLPLYDQMEVFKLPLVNLSYSDLNLSLDTLN